MGGAGGGERRGGPRASGGLVDCRNPVKWKCGWRGAAEEQIVTASEQHVSTTIGHNISCAHSACSAKKYLNLWTEELDSRCG